MRFGKEKKQYGVIQILKMKGKTVKIQKAILGDSNLLQYGMTGFMCYVKMPNNKIRGRLSYFHLTVLPNFPIVTSTGNLF